jgi:two-component system, chemotaxis family, chemotaxis protein CheY
MYAVLATALDIRFCECKVGQRHRDNDYDYVAAFLKPQSERTAVMHSRKRILVVTDSKPMTAFIAGILRKANHEEVSSVHDGVSALALLRAREHDLVICEWQMQPISGLVFTRLIKEDARLQKVRIIVIGSQGEDGVALLKGADGYVTKPFEPRDLKEKVEDVLSMVAHLASG